MIKDQDNRLNSPASLRRGPETGAPQSSFPPDTETGGRIGASEKEILHLKSSLEWNERKLEELREAHFTLHQEYQILKARYDCVEESYQVISNAFFWKITKPARLLADGLKYSYRPFRTGQRLLKSGVKSVRVYGVRTTASRMRANFHNRRAFAAHSSRPLFTAEELFLQRGRTFERPVLISILVPVYNTGASFLKEMIRSVTAQTYENWELCLADASDAAHAYVGRICREAAARDARINYQKLDRNLGISGNTNACMDMARGDYIGLLDHDDLLHPSALHEVMRGICEQGADMVYTDETTFYLDPSKDAFNLHFKPDYAPDTLRGNNYICHFMIASRALYETAGPFRPECDGSQDHDMILRLTEHAEKIVHIPEILYFWRAHRDSVAEDAASKPYVFEAGCRAVRDHLERVGLRGEVSCMKESAIYRIQYEIEGEPLVSILIPNKDHVRDLQLCIESIYNRTTYRNFEIIIIENNSTDPETIRYYRDLRGTYGNRRGESGGLRLIRWKGAFNYSAINNFGARFARGDYLLLLNNDTEIISPDWIQEMLMFCQRSDVGAAGAKLYYPDDTLQHGGIGMGLLTLAGHLHRGAQRKDPGYMRRLQYAQNLSAVTAACLMIRRDVWDELGGLDEDFAVAFNDVDLCMRVRQAGYLIVWTPYAELYHYESKSRGYDITSEQKKRNEREVAMFHARWREVLDAGDPYLNPNFDLGREDFSILPEPVQYFDMDES